MNPCLYQFLKFDFNRRGFKQSGIAQYIDEYVLLLWIWIVAVANFSQ